MTESDVPKTSTPLHHKWTLWYDNPRTAPPGTDWHDNLKNLGTFQTAEDVRSSVELFDLNFCGALNVFLLSSVLGNFQQCPAGQKGLP